MSSDDLAQKMADIKDKAKKLADKYGLICTKVDLVVYDAETNIGTAKLSIRVGETYNNKVDPESSKSVTAIEKQFIYKYDFNTNNPTNLGQLTEA